MQKMMLALALCATFSSYAQNTFYRCGNTYTDEPCPGGTTVDIRPTEGAHSMSGTKRMSNEAAMRNFYKSHDKAFEPLTGITPDEKARLREERRFKAIPRIKAEQ